MVVVDVDLHTGPVQQFRQAADAAGLFGVHQHQPVHGVEIDAFDVHHVEEVDHGLDEKIPQVLLLGAGKDHPGLGIELLGRQHGPHGVVVGVEMGGDDGETTVRGRRHSMGRSSP